MDKINLLLDSSLAADVYIGYQLLQTQCGMSGEDAWAYWVKRAIVKANTIYNASGDLKPFRIGDMEFTFKCEYLREDAFERTIYLITFSAYHQGSELIHMRRYWETDMENALQSEEVGQTMIKYGFQAFINI